MARSKGRGSSFADAFRDAITAAGGHGPRKSYTAQSPSARYNHLMRTKGGRDALEQAGLAAAPGTRARWAKGTQKPGKQYSGVINAVYEVMKRGSIPDSVKNGKMRITGRVGTGTDIRDRGSDNNAVFLIDLSEGEWDDVEKAVFDDLVGDAELEDMISEHLIEPDVSGSDTWFFPGSNYTVELDY